MSDVGPHLLGRVPSPPDPRDWDLAPFVGTDADVVNAAEVELKQTTVGYVNKYWTTPPSNTHWAKALALLAQVAPAPPPAPPGPSGDVSWADPEQTLDQGQTPHCTGFSGAQWGNTLPVDDKYRDADGHAIYYECKVIDGEPKAEDGSSMRSVAKAMQARGRLSAYAFASSLTDALAFLRTKGPVLVGSNWFDGMFDPDAQGFIKPTGSIAGGHAYLLVGVNADGSVLEFLNSWSGDWGLNGHFKMRRADFQTVLSDGGELVAAVEIP